MQFNIGDESIFKVLIGVCAAIGSWLFALVWKNHISIHKHQLWVEENYPSKREFQERLDAAINPIKENVGKQDEKLDKIMDYLYEIHKERKE